MDLLKERDRILADHAAQERYDPHWKAEAAAGRRITERPIAFLCDDEVVIPHPGDVALIVSGLESFLELAGEDSPLAKRAKSEPVVAAAVAKARRITESPPVGELRVPQQQWNSLSFCLNEVGLDVVMTGGE